MPGYPTAAEHLGQFEDQGAYERFIRTHPSDGRTNEGVPQYNGLFQKAQQKMAGGMDFFKDLFAIEMPEYPTAAEHLGQFEDQGAYERFKDAHPAGGMAAPGGTGIGSKVYDFLKKRGFGTK